MLMAIEAIICDVQFSAREPARPFHAVRSIQHGVVRLQPLDAGLFGHLRPKFFQVLLRVANELLTARDAQPLHEAIDIGSLYPFPAWFPNPFRRHSRFEPSSFRCNRETEPARM